MRLKQCRFRQYFKLFLVRYFLARGVFFIILVTREEKVKIDRRKGIPRPNLNFNGEIYDGDWSDGTRFVGKGIITFHNGDVF